MSDLMARHRTTMSDSDVAALPVGNANVCGWMSEEGAVPTGGTLPSLAISSYHASTRPSPGERVRALSRLEDNWDGHFAHPPRHDVVERVATLLDKLPPAIPIPDVNPSNDGGVILEWEEPGIEVLLLIGPTDVEVSIELDGVTTEGSLEAVEFELMSALDRVAAGS